MNHRRADKSQRVLTESQSISFFYYHLIVGKIFAKKLFDHGKRFRAGNDYRIRIHIHERGDIGGMIRFHMLNDQIIRLAGSQFGLKIFHPFWPEVLIDCIEYCYFLIQNQIRIV